MSDDIGFPHNHEEIAWNHFLAQFVGKKNTEDFVRSFYSPLNALDAVLHEMYTERNIDDAFGDGLDKIGCIVGLSRVIPDVIYLEFFGFDSQPSGRAFGVARMRLDHESYQDSMVMGDVEYRAGLHLKIALNNGHGTAEEVCYSVDTAFGIDGTHMHDMGNANALVIIPDLSLLPTDPRFYVIDKVLPRAAGVKIWLQLTHKTEIFGFSNQLKYYGFGVGIMARSPESNRPYPIP